MEPEDDDLIQPRMLQAGKRRVITLGVLGLHGFSFANKDGIVIGPDTPTELPPMLCPVSGKFILFGEDLSISRDAYADVRMAFNAWAIRTWAAEVFED